MKVLGEARVGAEAAAVRRLLEALEGPPHQPLRRGRRGRGPSRETEAAEAERVGGEHRPAIRRTEHAEEALVFCRGGNGHG